MVKQIPLKYMFTQFVLGKKQKSLQQNGGRKYLLPHFCAHLSIVATISMAAFSSPLIHGNLTGPPPMPPPRGNKAVLRDY